MSLLEVNSIGKTFPTRGEPLRVLDDCSLKLNAGETAAIVGPSGSGKSTLLAIIGTLDTPTAGSVSLDGIDPFVLSGRELADFRNQKIGFIFQDHHLLPQCTALENVLVPTLARGKASTEDQSRAEALLARVGLADRQEHLPAELSGGERQRVAIARALICKPRLLLADEPTGNLDRSTAQGVGELLLEVCQDESMALLVVTHSLDLAGRMRVTWELDAGRLVAPAET